MLKSESLGFGPQLVAEDLKIKRELQQLSSYHFALGIGARNYYSMNPDTIECIDLLAFVC